MNANGYGVFFRGSSDVHVLVLDCGDCCTILQQSVH